MTDSSGALLTGAGERLGRRLATRHSRRSFLGAVGGGSVALVVGGAAAPDSADAHSSNCGCSGLSVTCNTYWGNNSCPSWTCECGYWDMCTHDREPCGGSTPIKRWRDCCDGQCNDYRCYSGAPSCCGHKIYPQGCGTLNSTHVRCRYWTCHTTAAC